MFEFCLALLNDHIMRKEYDSSLVCALAVLGVKGNGWMDASNYPPHIIRHDQDQSIYGDSTRAGDGW